MTRIRISIDTAWLVSELTEDQFNFVREPFNERFRRGKVFKLRHYNFDLHYGVFMGRVDGYKPRHYNTLITLQHDTIENMPIELQRALNVGEWRIKRLDVAYDFELPLSRHFVLKHGNTKIRRKDSQQDYGRNYYVASKKAKVQAFVYDKKKQLAKKYGREIPQAHLTRFELRLRPKLSYIQKSLLDLDLNWLKPDFERIKFIQDYTKLPLTTEQKAILRKIRQRDNLDWKGISRYDRRVMRKALAAHSIDLWQEFNSRKYELFNWLYLPVETVANPKG